MSRKRVLGQDGATMLEVLAGFAVLGIMVNASMAGITATQGVNGHQERLSNALTIGEGVMEELYLRANTDADLSPGVHVRRYSLEGTEVPAGGDFTATWTVTPNVPVSEVNKIEINVSWKEGAGQRQIQLVNFRS